MRDYVNVVTAILRARWDLLRREPEAGYSTEFVLVTAIVAVAVAAIVLLVMSLVQNKASSIKL